MKRKNFLYALLACGALTFASCGKDDKNDKLSEEPTVEEVKNLPYSSLSPEQQKEKLAQDANAFITQMNDLSKEKAIEVFKNFNDYMSISEPFPYSEEDEVQGPVSGSVQPRNARLKSAEDIMSINSFYGKFTWNASKQDWDETESTSALVFEFPVGNSTGKIEVTGVSSEQTFDKVELPKQLKAKVYYGSEVVASIEVNGDVKVNNDEVSVPATASVTLQIGSYKLTQSFNKADKKATATFTKGSTTLISASASIKGDLDKALQEEDGNLITNANFSMKLMDNLSIVGAIDIVNYNKDEAALDAQCYPDGYWRNQNFDWDKAVENYTKGEVDLYNKYYDLYLVSTKDNTKIAKLQEKAVKDYSWYSVEVLKFNDDTEVETDVYFSEGFDAVIKNFESFLKSFE